MARSPGFEARQRIAAVSSGGWDGRSWIGFRWQGAVVRIGSTSLHTVVDYKTVGQLLVTRNNHNGARGEITLNDFRDALRDGILVLMKDGAEE